MGIICRDVFGCNSRPLLQLIDRQIVETLRRDHFPSIPKRQTRCTFFIVCVYNASRRSLPSGRRCILRLRGGRVFRFPAAVSETLTRAEKRPEPQHNFDDIQEGATFMKKILSVVLAVGAMLAATGVFAIDGPTLFAQNQPVLQPIPEAQPQPAADPMPAVGAQPAPMQVVAVPL